MSHNRHVCSVCHMIEKHQRENNKPIKNKDGSDWGRLRRITKDELERFRLIFSRCAIRDVTPFIVISGDDVIWSVEILAGNNHFTGFKPNLDCSLHDGDLCSSGNRSSYLSNGVRHWRLCGGLFSTQAFYARWVSQVHNNVREL